MITSAALTASATSATRRPGLVGERAALRARREPDDDVDARLVEVQGVGVALAAVADDRDGLAGQRRRVGVVVVVHPCAVIA